MTVERPTLVLTLIAGLLALVVVVVVWRQAGSRAHVARLRHPATPPPVTLILDASGPAPRWRVTARSGVPTTAIDILTYRPAGVEEPWFSEPIVEPIVLEPGGSELLPSRVFGPAAQYDVVIAWTVRHPAGDVQGSRTLSVSTAPGSAATHDGAFATLPPYRPAWVTAVGAMALLLLLGVIVAAVWQLIDAGDTVSIADVTSSTALPSTAPAEGTTSTDLPTTSIAPSTTAGAAASTAAESTTSPTTTAASTSTTSSATTTTTTTTTTVPAPGDGRRVLISGRVEDCRFGSDCIIASFSLVGFAASGEYVCEFDDTSRFVFRYTGDRADDACATAGPSPSITIEVDGVRSATITRESPGGA